MNTRYTRVQRRIIDEYRNYDPMRAFADIARASRNLPARD